MEAEIKPGLFDSLIYSELERREISEEIIVMLGASDEAGLAIYFILKILGLYPLVQDKVYEEIVIPAGVGVVVPIISLHQNPKYWGPDADHFDPERFRPERLATVPDNAYTPFSCGPRGCPGYKFAQNLIRISLCSILRKYKVVGTPAAGPAPHIRTKYEVTLRPVNDSIELEPRC